MTKKIFKNKLWGTVIVLCFALALSASNAFAWGHGGHGGHGGGRYYWHGGRWYGPGWFGFDVAVSALAIGAIVEGLPYGYTTVVAGSVPYYYYDGYYYRPYSPGGYIVVQQPVATYPVVSSPAVVQPTIPVVVQSPQALPAQTNIANSNVTLADAGEEFTINIPNTHGGYTPVTLKSSGKGFIGPQGEYYSEFPKIKLLRVMYAK